MVSVASPGQKAVRSQRTLQHSGARREGVFPGGGTLPPCSSISPRTKPEAWGGDRRTGFPRKGSDRVGVGADHCFSNRRKGATSTRTSEVTCKSRSSEQFGQFRQRSRRHTTWSVEKELARAGYHWRTSRKSKGLGNSKSVPLTGKEAENREDREGHRTTGPRRCPQPGTVGPRSTTSLIDNATFGKFEGQEKAAAEKEKTRFKSKCKQLGQRFESERLKLGSSSSSWPCESRGNIPIFEKENVQAAVEACAQICARSRKGSGGGESCLSPIGDRKEDQLGKTKESPTLSLHAVRHPDQVAEGPDREGHIADSALPEGSPSGGTRQRLEHCMAPDTLGRPMVQASVGWRSGGSRKCHCISEKHGRAQSQCRSASKFKQWADWRSDRRLRRQAEGKERQGQGQGQRRGEERVKPQVNSQLHRFDFRPSDAKTPGGLIGEALKDYRGSFGRFLRLLHEAPYLEGSRPRTPQSSKVGNAKIFPSLLVGPISAPIFRSSRRNCRRRGRASTWEDVRVVWSLFTFLEGGSPHTDADQKKLADRAAATFWTPQHAEYAGYLHDEIHKFNRLRYDMSLGRGLEQLEKLVTSIYNSAYSPGNCDLSVLQAAARDVKPERMSLPEQAGIVDPANHLKGAHKEAFLNMHRDIPLDEPPLEPVQSCFKVRDQDVIPVYEKLLDSGVCVLIPEEMALRDRNNRIVSAGLFAVPHKESSDRVICDRRPQNQIERRLVWARLPHGCLLTQIILPKNCSIRGSGDDLSNYFYLLKHQEKWLHRNCVGKPIPGSKFKKYGCDPKRRYILCMKVVPMGDCNAVDIAQQTHLEILKEAGVMRDDETIAYRSPLPPKAFMEGLYIDDHIAIQITAKRKSKAKKGNTYRDVAVIRDSRAYYKQLGIPVSEKKAFTKEGQFQAWGTAVDSNSGRVGAPLQKLKQLSNLILQVCRLPKVTQKLIQKCLGLVVHPCMHKRIVMCLLQEVYIWVNKLKPGKTAKMPLSVKEELLSLALLLPLCHSNIRHEVSCRIGATDASLTGGGRACTLTTPSIAQTLFRYGVHKGEAVRLDWESGALAPPTDINPAPAELEDLMNAHVWNTTHKCKFGHKQHINLLEMKMVKAELVDRVHSSTDGTRHVVLVDSRVVAGALGRGRSSSKQLNRIIRSMLGWVVAGRKDIILCWVQSKKNPSDHPSRGAAIPEPRCDDPILKKVFETKIPDIQTRRSNRFIDKCSKTGILEHEEEFKSENINTCSRELPARHPCTEKCEEGGREKVSLRSAHPAQKFWEFREIFAGCGRLTNVFRKRKAFRVGSPVEILQHGKVSPDHNVLCDKTFARLCKDAAHGKQIWHFGLPCSSFSLMQNMNGGTRTTEKAEGDGTLKRERIGNEIAARVVMLCIILSNHGSFFTIENPKTSYLWKLTVLGDLFKLDNCQTVEFDQCEYCLKIPNESGVLALAKKSTTIVGTLPHLSLLKRKCTKTHSHVQVIGGVRTKQGWKKRSELAGAYPQQLCGAYHKCCEKAFCID